MHVIVYLRVYYDILGGTQQKLGIVTYIDIFVFQLYSCIIMNVTALYYLKYDIVQVLSR